MDDKEVFLIEMYKQMFADINQHVSVVWQSIGTLAASIGLLALAEKGVLPIDIGIMLIVILCIWMIANVLEASYWYNRNLVIIANIERHFLDASDANDIQYYFTKHREGNAMIGQLKLQCWLGAMILLGVFIFHFVHRVLPGILSDSSSFKPLRVLPYLFLAFGFVFLRFRAIKTKLAYEDFLKRSPGKSIESAAVNSIGHGQHSSSKQVWEEFFKLKK